MLNLYTSYRGQSLFEIDLNIKLSTVATQPITYNRYNAHLICTVAAKTKKQSIKKNIKHFS